MSLHMSDMASSRFRDGIHINGNGGVDVCSRYMAELALISSINGTTARCVTHLVNTGDPCVWRCRGECTARASTVAAAFPLLKKGGNTAETDTDNMLPMAWLLSSKAEGGS
jgi:hypothetical protein